MAGDDEDGEGGSVLYDVLVYKEWENEPDEGQNGQEDEGKASAGWSLPGGGLWRPQVFRRAPNAVQRLRELRDLQMSWDLAVTPDASLLAVAQDDILEILSRRAAGPEAAGPSYVAVARAQLPGDPAPHLRRLAWSDDAGTFLAVTCSNGRVLVYDAQAELAFAVVSNNLPPWDAPPDQSRSYCHVSFLTQGDHRGSEAEEWHSELILVDNAGRVNTFLCSASGYQELASTGALAARYPSGVGDAVLLPSLALLYACGPVRGSRSGITCWRLTEEEPFFEEVELQSQKPKGGGLFGWAPSAVEDFAYCLAASDDLQSLAAAHMSGAITVWSVPSLVLRRTIPAEDQACYDDVNPHCLQKSLSAKAAARKSIFLTHPLRFQPTALRWWDESSIVVARLSGGLTILPLENPSSNLLGESAEFFAPSCVISRCLELGFFALEVEGERKFQQPDSDADRRAGLWDYITDLADSFFGNKAEDEQEEGEGEGREAARVSHRLFYLQSTSPEELFQKKIDDEDYGEAIILARHFNLDCDRVYAEQWRLSDHSPVAAQDYLAKVEDAATVLSECLRTVPATAEACQCLLSFGLAKAAECELAGEGNGSPNVAEGAKRVLQDFMVRLELYLAVVGGEDEYSAAEFSSFRAAPLLDSAKQYARDGQAGRLKALMRMAVGELGGSVQEVFSSLPEPLDPMPDVADLAVSLHRAAKLGSAAGDVSLPGEAWFRERAAEMVVGSGQSDFAVALLHLAANLNLESDPAFYHHMATFDSLVFERGNLACDFAKIRKMSDPQLLDLLLDKPRPSAAKVFKTLGLPFLDRVEQCQSGSSVRLFKGYVAEKARGDFTLASDLLRVVAENLEETWFSREDLREMGMAVVWNSTNTNIQSLVAFLSYIKGFCPEGEAAEGEEEVEFTSLLEAVRALGLVAKYDTTATIAGVKSAQSGDGGEALKLVQRVLGKAREGLRARPHTRDEVFRDVINISRSCRGLELRDSFRAYCKCLLELGDESAIGLARDVMAAEDAGGGLGKRAGGGGSLSVEVRRSAEEFGLAGCLGEAEVAALVSDAAGASLESAKDFRDPRVRLAGVCLAISPSGCPAEVRDVVEACGVLSGFDFISPLRPARIKNLKSAAEVGELVYNHLDLGAITVDSREKLVKFGSLVSSAFKLDPKGVRATLLSTAARMTLEADNRTSCTALCNDLVDENLGAGWPICSDLADALLADCGAAAVDGEVLARLCRFSAAHCDDPERMEAESKRLLLAAGRRGPVAVRDVVPGFTFFENSLESWDSAGQARRAADLFQLDSDAYAAGERTHPAWHQHVFEQDPPLALASLPLGDDDGDAVAAAASEEESDSLYLLRLALAETLLDVWPLAKGDAASLTLEQLCRINLDSGGAMKALRSKFEESGELPARQERPEKVTQVKVEGKADSKPGGDETGGWDEAEEDLEVPDDAEEATGVRPSEVEACGRLADLRDRGVPLGMRIMSSCVVKESK